MLDGDERGDLRSHRAVARHRPRTGSLNPDRTSQAPAQPTPRRFRGNTPTHFHPLPAPLPSPRTPSLAPHHQAPSTTHHARAPAPAPTPRRHRTHAALTPERFRGNTPTHFHPLPAPLPSPRATKHHAPRTSTSTNATPTPHSRGTGTETFPRKHPHPPGRPWSTCTTSLPPATVTPSP